MEKSEKEIWTMKLINNYRQLRSLVVEILLKIDKGLAMDPVDWTMIAKR